MTYSWLRRPLGHLPYSRDNATTLHHRSRCCQCRCSCRIVRLWFTNCWYPRIGCAVLLIYFTEVVSCVLLSRLCQFVKLHLVLQTSLHALLNQFGDCAHHPARFVIFAQLALPWLLIILVFPILAIVRTGTITQTASDRNHHRLKSLFGRSVRQSCVFRIPCFFLLLLNRCVCVSNSLSIPSGFSLNMILDPCSLSWLLKKCVTRRFSATSIFLNHKPRKAPRARTHSASKPRLLSFAWWHHWVDSFVDLPYLPAWSGEIFFLRALTIVVCVDFVVGRDVACCTIWTIWRQDASFKSRLVCLIILNQAKSAFWLSINWE